MAMACPGRARRDHRGFGRMRGLGIGDIMKSDQLFDRRNDGEAARERREAKRTAANELFCQAASQAILLDLKARGVSTGDAVDLRAYWPELADQTHIRSLDFVGATGALVGAGLLESRHTGHRYELTLTEAGALAIERLDSRATPPDGRALRAQVVSALNED